eukprot:TRINITY_DN10647_c0_g2_i1.p1 TRINITY_DN10647_c0_g2~~TRINITY_DN10647_c0_g2_i1.p1  ORF type:complete len:270 (-),score=6.62 TRINITY_DN10647_c0_g2_i1:283-1092(-)
MVSLLSYIIFGLILKASDGKSLVRRENLSVTADGSLAGQAKTGELAGCKHFLTHDVATETQLTPWRTSHNKEEFEKYECGTNQALVSMYSVYDDGRRRRDTGDRQWKLQCRPLKGFGASMTDCKWSGTSSKGQNFHELPNTNELEVITGIESSKANRRRRDRADRLYKFKSCRINGVSAIKSWWDGSWRNQFQRPMSMQEPATDFIRRWQSIWHNKNSDRSYKFYHSQFCLNPSNCEVGSWETWSQECNTQPYGETASSAHGVSGAVVQ